MRIQDSVLKVLFRLDDSPTLPAFLTPEVENALRDGYSQFVRRTKALFDMRVILNAPAVADHSAGWEEQYMDLFQGIGNYSSSFEKNWADNGVGPVGMTSVSERSYGGPNLPGGFLPPQATDVDRVTFDFVPLEGDYTKSLAPAWSSYEKETGFPFKFTIDGDDKNFLRIVPQPSGNGTLRTYTYASDTKEIVFDASAGEVDTSFIDGPTDGVLLDVPGEFPCGEVGVVLDIVSEQMNVRVEMFRLGLSDEYEIPLVFTKYVEFFAMSKLLERDGPEQDLKLAKHFMDRYEIGVRRAQKRIEKLQTQEAASFGPAGRGARYPSNWPANYGIPSKNL